MSMEDIFVLLAFWGMYWVLVAIGTAIMVWLIGLSFERVGIGFESSYEKEKKATTRSRPECERGARRSRRAATARRKHNGPRGTPSNLPG